MQLSKEEYARKRIHNGCSVRIENSVTRDNCSASLGKPFDAEQLPRDEISICTSQPFNILIIFLSKLKNKEVGLRRIYLLLMPLF